MRICCAILAVSLLQFVGCSPRYNPSAPPANGNTTSTSVVSADSPPIVWQITEGLQAPESAFYDAESGFLFCPRVAEVAGMKRMMTDGCRS